uniref:Proteasome subunit beta n=1 Tax=Florenciella parvula TaxID=236787 RepID=A0A7S2CLY8_9STRA|eukprot:CAMPEP_0182532444 /NCGR_PEP_ID=MMETSP1323-20130603/11745_1 /TAXON_ID=236787 /ORGANISM="Florenciella parvula, Strain RCC1693" /LENGTH=297 /DNA_ID=CAMNT_0024742193 /DNA_START=31 /DNA_END=924 /DNA_ORIENTATION=+
MAQFNDMSSSGLEQLPTGERPRGGFAFDLCSRDQQIGTSIAAGGGRLPQAMKTGTTIVGVIYKDGVVLGADTRATGGTEVCDKNCEKIHYLSDNIYCCGAGTAADTEKTTEMISSQLELHRLNTGMQSRVVTAVTLLKRMLFRYQGHVSAALVLGGCDVNGSHLYHIYPHGSTGKLPYVTMGSGSLAAMSVFETDWKEDMEEAEAIEVVKQAIRAGIFNDLGSGSNVDVTVIRKPEVGGGTTVMRGFDTPNEVADLRAGYTRPKAIVVPRGATAVLSKEVSLSELVTVEDAPEPMAF